MNASTNIIGRLIVGCVFACCLTTTLHAQPSLPGMATNATAQVTNVFDYSAYYSNNLASVAEWLHDGYALPDGTPADFQTIMNQSASSYATAAMENDWHQSALDSALTFAWNTGEPSQVLMADGTTSYLVSIDEGPLFIGAHNIEAAKTISTTNVWPGGSAGLSLNGTNRTIFMWDEGRPRLTHSEFGSRVSLLPTSFTNVSSHSTAVVGTLAAGGVNNINSNGVFIGNAAKGMSFAGLIQAGDFRADLSAMPGEAGTNNMRFSNHSYGHSSGWVLASGSWYWYGYSAISTNQDAKFGNYSTYTAKIDELGQNAPNYLGIWSAGNDVSNAPPVQPTNHIEYNYQTGIGYTTSRVHPKNGDPGGYDTVSDFACAKNILTVGAVYPNDGYTAPTNVLWAGFSSCGPTDDGRIKPDVVAAGVNIITTYNTSDYAYQFISGTSFAAPSVAGSANLLGQYYQQLHTNSADLLSSTIKGLIIHTADTGTTNAGPSYRVGWGVMNTAKAAGLLANDATNGLKNFIKEVLLNHGQYIQFPVLSAGGTNNPLIITICWTDPAGAGSALTNFNNPAAKLVNDLDLRIYSPDGTTNFPWILDPDLTNRTATARAAAATRGDDTRNNVEQVYIPNPTNGTYLVKVTHKGTLTNSQWVSLLVNGNVAQEPPAFALNKILRTGTNAIAVGWPTVVGQRYQAQYVDVPGNSNYWQNIGAQVSARLTNAVIQLPMNTNGNTRLYRVQQVL
ncbi:MAG: S8 family serine peptidase [Verrucomicrobiota bacterium]